MKRKLSIRVKEESEKAELKLNTQKTPKTQHLTKIIASSLIISSQIDGGKVETVTDFIFSGSKITWMVTAAMKLKATCSLKEKL